MNYLTTNLDNLLNAAVANRVSPAIAAVIGTPDTSAPQYSFASGLVDTIFDLASLTKVLSTTLISAEAILLGKLSLDETPFAQWPTVRVRDLLQHTSGLPAWQNLYRRGLSRREIVDSALGIPLSHPPRSKTVYSDIGIIALGNLLESRLKERLDTIFGDLSLQYYGARGLSYLPTDQKSQSIENVAPTGICHARRRRLKGEVNDLNAYGMEGVAAHAGLFGSIADVERAAAFFLSAMKAQRSPMDKLIHEFACAPGKRAIGFDKAEPRGKATGGALSNRAVGHLGFTGTSMWIDPLAANGSGAYFVFLTNHLEVSPRKSEIMQLLRDFHREGARWAQRAVEP